MLKRFFSPLLITALFACNQPVKQTAAYTDTTGAGSASQDKPVTPDQLITPGKGIGHLTINMNADSAITLLGRPDSSDAAMGSSLMTWYAKHNTAGYKTSIFAHHNMGGTDEMVSHIKKILVTSPWFKTADGISAGTDLDAIIKRYAAKPVANYVAQQKTINIYDDIAAGIAFDIDSLSKKCVAITVHAPKDGSGTYLNIH